MGLKQVNGINRVTLKSTENAYVVFGEAKFHDYQGGLPGDKAQNFKKADEVNAKEELKTDVKVEDDADNEDVIEDQGDIEDDQIKTLMEYSGCSRNKAIKALKKTGGDVVEAI